MPERGFWGMSIGHVVFDIDGTMVDTEVAFQLALQETMEQLLGRSASMAELHYTYSMTTEATLLALGFPDIPAAHQLWEKKCVEKLGMVRLYDGISQLMEALLLRGYTLGVVSSSNRWEYRMLFLPLGLGDCFETVILAEDTQEHKPHPAPILRYLEKTGIRPEEMLYVGDSTGDMDCAKAAGVHRALACWCRTPAEGEVDTAEYRLERPGQLLDLLLELEAAERL